MLVCMHCRTLAADVRNRISDELLCNNCDRVNLEALEVQRQQNRWGQHGSTPSTTDGTDLAEGNGLLGRDGPPGGDGHPDGHPGGGVALDSIGATSSSEVATVQEVQPAQSSDDANSANAAKCCIPECKFGGKIDKRRNTLTCCHCMAIFHVTCFYPENKDIPMVFTCVQCRKIPSVISVMCSMMDSMQRTLLRLDKSYQELDKSYRNLNSKLSDKDTRIDALTTDNSRLTERVAEAQSELDKTKWSSFRTNDRETVTNKTLVIGSSIIRDMDETKLQNVEIKSISSATVKDVHKELSSLNGNYEKVIIVAGGNDCDTAGENRREISDVIDDFRNLVTDCKTKAQSVSIATVCPRIKGQDVTERIDALNAGLQVLCEDEQCTLIDNEGAFKLGNGAINDGYLIKKCKTHLTYAGTNCLAKNLGLIGKPGHEHDICTRKAAYKDHHRPAQSQERSNRGHYRQTWGRRPSSDHMTSGRQTSRRTQGGHGDHSAAQSDFQHRSRSQSPRRPQGGSRDRSGARPQSPRRTQGGSRDRSGARPQSYRRTQSRSGRNANDNDTSGEWHTVHPRSRHPSGSRTPGRSQSSRNPERPGNRNSCGFCGERNHRQDTCWHGKPVTCDKCKGPGHKSKHHDGH